MNICVYVCMHACAFMCACEYVCICTGVCIYIFACMLLFFHPIVMKLKTPLKSIFRDFHSAGWQTLPKTLDISSATPQVASDLLKVLATMSETTVRKSAVQEEDLKPYWKSEKMPHFPRWSANLTFTGFSKISLST